jgi:ABC-type sugar transport system substrate-binding protein
MTNLRDLMVAILTVAISVPASAEDLRVGFISSAVPPEFWNLVGGTMKDAARQLGIDVEIRNVDRSREKAVAAASELLAAPRPPDYLVASNDVGIGVDLIRLTDAAKVKLILINNDIDPKDWAAFGEPRTKHRNWLGSIVPDHEAAGYGIATAILTAAAKTKSSRPLKVLALAGDEITPASIDRVRGLKRGVEVMTRILGPKSVELVEVRHLDWSEKMAESSVREFVKTGPRIDALWAANDPMALGGLRALGENGYRPGLDVLVGGLNWSQPAVDRVLKNEMVITHGGHFLLGAWAMVMLRDLRDGRDFAEEDVRLQVPMGAIDLAVARRFPEIGKVDWSKVDFTRFSKTRNPAVVRYEFSPEAVLDQLRLAR